MLLIVSSVLAKSLRGAPCIVKGFKVQLLMHIGFAASHQPSRKHCYNGSFCERQRQFVEQLRVES